MYFQVANILGCERENYFVLDPSYRNDLGSYETHEGEIKALVTNKKDISKFCRECFGSCAYQFDRKVGPFNQYIVGVKEPIKEYIGVTTDDPPFAECVLFTLTVSTAEVTKRDIRPALLSQWVLGLEHPTQFNRLLKLNFNVEDIGNGSVKISKKVIDARSDSDS